jgi:hypothetical protein
LHDSVRAIALTLCDKWPQCDSAGGGIANGNIGGLCGNFLAEIRGDRILHEDPS